MKKLAFISVLVVVIGTCFSVSAFAEFYVIPVEKKDSDLVPENIRNGVEVLGVTGTLHGGIKVTSTIVPKTGQTGCWNVSGETITCSGTGQDGDHQKGITPSMEPSSETPYTAPSWTGERFTDNNDGTVTDNLTGLVWLENANCFGVSNWSDALSDCNSLADGSCGLTDGSTAGDWRLPNINELHSLIDSGESNPALPDGHPFTSVQIWYYWSSTTVVSGTSNAWYVYPGDGFVTSAPKNSAVCYVWPVRGGN